MCSSGSLGSEIIFFMPEQFERLTNSNKSPCCIDRECPLENLNILRDGDFIAYVKAHRCSTSQRFVFLCANDDFERLALKHDNCTNCRGALISYEVVRNLGLCDSIHKCVELSERNQAFGAFWNLSLVGARVCMDMRNERKCKKAIKRIRWMGGIVEPSFCSDITHVVCDKGSHYFCKNTIPGNFKNIVTLLWIRRCWYSSNSDIDDSVVFKMFHGLRFFLYGYEPEERVALMKCIVREGGMIAKVDTQCTHFVVKDMDKVSPDVDMHDHEFVVNNDWLTKCFELGGRIDEAIFNVEDTVLNISKGSTVTTAAATTTTTTTTTTNAPEPVTEASRKRGFLSALNQVRSPRGLVERRKSSRKLSSSPKRTKKSLTPKAKHNKSSDLEKVTTRRMHRIREFHQTECNYIGILDLILKFKRPLIDEQILSPIEANQIMSKIELMRIVHISIRESVADILDNQNYDSPIGEIFLNKESELTRAYTPYVNSMDDFKMIIVRQRQTNPRFCEKLSALEANFCPRESFTDLLIRPVQRLASIIVLLNSLLDVTPDCHPDHSSLVEAVNVVRKATASVNQSKEVLECGKLILNTVNDIQGCPPNVCSQHRRLIYELSIKELSNELFARDAPLTVFVFSDCLEIARAKRRATRGLSSFRESLSSSSFISAGSPATMLRSRHKYKHVFLLNMLQITNVHKFNLDVSSRESVDENQVATVTLPNLRGKGPAVSISFLDDNYSPQQNDDCSNDYRTRTFTFQINHAKSASTQRLSYYAESKDIIVNATNILVDLIVEKIIEMKCLKDQGSINELTHAPDQLVTYKPRNWRKTLGKQISNVLNFDKSNRNQ